MAEAQPDLFDHVDFHALALSIWKEREQRFPAFVRRPAPDAIDYATGAWDLVFAEARRRYWEGR